MRLHNHATCSPELYYTLPYIVYYNQAGLGWVLDIRVRLLENQYSSITWVQSFWYIHVSNFRQDEYPNLVLAPALQSSRYLFSLQCYFRLLNVWLWHRCFDFGVFTLLSFDPSEFWPIGVLTRNLVKASFLWKILFFSETTPWLVYIWLKRRLNPRGRGSTLPLSFPLFGAIGQYLIDGPTTWMNKIGLKFTFCI